MMDNYFQSMERLNFELTWNVKVQELLTSNKYSSFPNDYRYDLYRITQDYKLYKSAYASVDLFYTYIADNDKVILPGAVWDASFAYQTLHSNAAFSLDRWSSVLNQKVYKGFRPMVRIDEDGKILKTAAYVSTFLSDKEGELAANVIMIDQSRILGAIQDIELFNKGHVLILNEDNEILISNSQEPLPNDFPYEKIQNGSNFFYYTKSGEKYEVQTLQSNCSGLKYVSIISSSFKFFPGKSI